MTLTDTIAATVPAEPLDPLRAEPSPDERSVSLLEQIQKKWREQVRRLSPADRAAWLRSQEAIVALGARRCNELLKSIDASKLDFAARVPSAAWLDAWWGAGGQLPADLEPDRPTSSRAGAVRMVLSVCKTRIGASGKPSRRLTPPQAVDVEDFLDAMTPVQAAVYEYPPSPSARVIWEIESRPPSARRGPKHGPRRRRRSRPEG